MSDDVIGQLRAYLDFASDGLVEEPVAAARSMGRTLRWYQRGPALAVLAGVLVLAVGLPALFLGSNGSAPNAGSQSGQHAESPDVTLLDAGHAAVALNAIGSVGELSAAAEGLGIDFVCGTFVVPDRDGAKTSGCMVSDDGVIAVIAVDRFEGLEYVLSGAVVGDSVVPVDETDVYGVAASADQLRLSVKIGDTVVGTVAFGG